MILFHVALSQIYDIIIATKRVVFSYFVGECFPFYFRLIGFAALPAAIER